MTTAMGMEYPESVLREGYAISPLRTYASFERCRDDRCYRILLDQWATIWLRRRAAKKPSGYTPSIGTVQHSIGRAIERMAANDSRYAGLRPHDIAL